MDHGAKQRGVVTGIIVGATITFVVFAGAILAGPLLLPPEATVAERISIALKSDVFIAIWLGMSIARLASHRFFSPEDIDGGGLTQGTDRANILQATLQNTLEQTVLAVLTHLAWSIVMPASWMLAIPAAVVLFLCGRMLFVRGYGGGAPSRATGFALTFFPTALMLVVVVAATIWTTFT